jgi:large subunit ribosomal protein L31
MKANIHPEYVDVDVTCACGNHWRTRSTKASIRTDICSKCHPFFTGEQRIVDTAGRVERFRRRYAKAEQADAAQEPEPAAEAQEPAEATTDSQ